MKRVGTALMATLVLISAFGSGTARAAPKPLTIREFDPFWPLVQFGDVHGPATGTTVGGCQLQPGADCADAAFDFKEGVELIGADLSGADLRGAALRPFLNGSSLATADARGANLNGTSAAAITAPFARFEKADMAGLDGTLGRFADADLRGAELYESNFFAADLAGADLRGTNLGNELAGAVLSGADLRGVSLRGHDLQFADLSHARLSRGALKEANLCDTVLPSGRTANGRKRCELPPFYGATSERQPTIKPTDARYSLLLHAAGTWRSPHREKCGEICPEGGQWLTHLRGRSHAYQPLGRAREFKGKVLALANFTQADLRGAVLRGTVMPGAAASGANLIEADLAGADLTFSEFARAKLDAATLVDADARDADLTRADLEGANLSGARLGAASLVETNLRGADLQGADLSGADLYRAAVDPSFPAGAILCDTVMPDGTIASPGSDCEHP